MNSTKWKLDPLGRSTALTARILHALGLALAITGSAWPSWAGSIRPSLDSNRDALGRDRAAQRLFVSMACKHPRAPFPSRPCALSWMRTSLGTTSFVRLNPCKVRRPSRSSEAVPVGPKLDLTARAPPVLVVTPFRGRKHLPVVELARAARDGLGPPACASLAHRVAASARFSPASARRAM